MILIFSTNDLWGSKVIRWGLDESCSHFAVGFFEDDPSSATVLESRISEGVGTCSLENFEQRNQIVHLLKLDISYEEEASLFLWLYQSTKGRKYDTKALLFWVWTGIKIKFFGGKIPPRNEFNDSEMLYCVEVLEELSPFLSTLGIDLTGIDISMLSPEMAYRVLKYKPSVVDLLPYVI